MKQLSIPPHTIIITMLPYYHITISSVTICGITNFTLHIIMNQILLDVARPCLRSATSGQPSKGITSTNSKSGTVPFLNGAH